VISDIARILGEDNTHQTFLDKAVKTHEALGRVFWDEEEGFFFDRAEDGVFARVYTPAAFILLLAEVPTEEQYEKMKEKLLDSKKFWTKYPLSTVSVEDDTFDPENYWRGPAWLIVNYEVMDGLFEYDPESAFKLFFKTIDLLTNTGDPTSREHYNCLTGAGGGALDYAWDGIMNKLIINRILGVRPYPEKVLLEPFLPKELDNIAIENLGVAGTRMNVAYLKKEGIWTATVKNNGGKTLLVEYEKENFVIEPGNEMSLDILCEN
jgi:glycogen debranching enzyme